MVVSKSPVKVVCDAGPLIHLDEVECLPLLVDFDDVLVPEPVWREVVQHRPTALGNPDVALRQVSVTISSDAAFQSLVKSLSLDYGEQAALTLLQTHPEAIFLTDDAAARLAAVALSYRVHGSIGILVRAIRRHQKTREEILAILRDLPARSTLHIRPALLKEVIARVEDERQ